MALLMFLSVLMFTLKDSSRPPCPPFSSLSSSPTWPRPSAAWLCRCSSSWRLSSSAARVLPWIQFTQTKCMWDKAKGLLYAGAISECGCANVCHLKFGKFVGFVAGVFSIDQLCQQEVSKLRTLEKEGGGIGDERERWPSSCRTDYRISLWMIKAAEMHPRFCDCDEK